MFEKIREEIKNYADQYNILKTVYVDKNKELKANYIGKMFDTEFAANHEQFNKAVLALQEESKGKVNEAFNAIFESIRASVTDDLGADTIAELTLIKGMKLTEFEIKGYAEKYTGNTKALRILNSIAEQNGVPFNFTSHEDVIETIKKLMQMVTAFINGYRGDYKLFSGTAQPQSNYNFRLLLAGDPINLAEDVYNDFMNPFKGSASNGI